MQKSSGYFYGFFDLISGRVLHQRRRLWVIRLNRFRLAQFEELPVFKVGQIFVSFALSFLGQFDKKVVEKSPIEVFWHLIKHKPVSYLDVPDVGLKDIQIFAPFEVSKANQKLKIRVLWSTNLKKMTLPVHFDLHEPKPDFATRDLKAPANDPNQAQDGDDDVPKPQDQVHLVNDNVQWQNADSLVTHWHPTWPIFPEGATGNPGKCFTHWVHQVQDLHFFWR